MVPGLYSAASSMRAAELNHEVISGNLANASLPGYRRQVLSFESYVDAVQQHLSSVDPAATTSLPVGFVHTDFSVGQLHHTGRSLDVGLRGDGFFVLDGPRGPVYTRNGAFQINERGELTSFAGLPVRGGGGPISVPLDGSEISIREDGSVVAGTGEIGRLELAHFQNPSELLRVGEALFEAPPGVRSQPGTSTVHQFYRELSNVNVVDEMVQMIAGMRHYEASQRALRTIAEAIQLNTNPQAG